MRKILVIARRDYRASVRSKGFIVSLVLMPVLMTASIGLQVLFQKLEDTKEKKYAVVNRFGGDLRTSLETSAKEYNDKLVFDAKTGKQNASTIELEFVDPSKNTPEAIAEQRYELSQRVERDEIEGILEIGPGILTVKETTSPDKI